MPHRPLLILNGPNLNLLGTREPDIYGRETLADIERRAREKAESLGHSIDFRQTNHEGVLVDWVQEARDTAAGLILNAGAYTHTSIALHDALLTLAIACIEVHLSNIYKREDFRQRSYISKAALGVICGFGPKGYELAIEALAAHLATGSVHQ